MIHVTAKFGARVVPPQDKPRDPTKFFRAFTDWPRTKAEIPAIVAQMKFARANEETIGKAMAEQAEKEGNRVAAYKGYQNSAPPAVPGNSTREKLINALDTPKTTAELAQLLAMNKKTVNSAIRGLVWDGTVAACGFREKSQIWKCTGDR